MMIIKIMTRPAPIGVAIPMILLDAVVEAIRDEVGDVTVGYPREVSRKILLVNKRVIYFKLKVTQFLNLLLQLE